MALNRVSVIQNFLIDEASLAISSGVAPPRDDRCRYIPCSKRLPRALAVVLPLHVGKLP